MYFLFRFSQPERLVQPESFGNFMQFLSAMETPSSPFLPSSWSAEILAGTLFNRETEQGFFFALLASYALFLPVAASWISGAVYFEGWSKAQESRQGRRKFVWLDRLLDGATRLFPETTRAIMIKDIKTFLRDTTQWSQLFLLLALIVVYLYNFKVLPLDRSPMPAGTMRTLVSFANLALAGFVLSAVAVRFAFPAISLEGKAFWILQTSPISLRALLWSKFWLIFVPLLLLGELLVFLSNLLLHVPDWMMALSLITVCLMTFGIAAIGVGLGALYPNFNYDNAAEIPTSFGGAVAMILSVGFHRARGRHRSLADLSVGHGLLAPGPGFSAAPRAHRAIADHGCGFDRGGGNAVIATRHKTPRTAKRLTATSGGHSCSSFTHCINRPAADRFQPF